MRDELGDKVLLMVLTEPSPIIDCKADQLLIIRDGLYSTLYLCPEKAKNENESILPVKAGLKSNKSPFNRAIPLRSRPLYWVNDPPINVLPLGSGAMAKTWLFAPAPISKFVSKLPSEFSRAI